MEKQAGFWFQAVLLLAALSSTLSVEEVQKVGGVLVLRPPKSGPFTNILWRHNGNLVAEWTEGGGDVETFGSFRGRTTLDTTTGHLTIKDLKLSDSGVYTVELSNTIQDERYDVKVIQELSKPEIWVRPVSCSPNLTSCTLVCKTPTEGAEPVTYSWKEDDGEWKESKQNLNITKAEDGHVQKFTCRIKNPGSEEEGEHRDNPLQTLLPSVVLNPTQAEGVLFLKIGGVLVLRPPKSGPFTNVLWKHNGNLVAEWTEGGGDVETFGSFRGRTTLDTTTGHLTIKDLKLSDSGVYTVELSNTVQDERYDVKVIKELSKPEIWVQLVSCSPHSTSCTLTCKAPTEGAEPVTYSWKEDDGEWTESKQNLNITKAEDGHVQKFTCRIKNPISEEESERCDNPLFQPLWPEIMKIVLRVCLLATLLGILGGFLAWQKRDTLRRVICPRRDRKDYENSP